MVYDKGTIKLVWIPSDYMKMESIMFDSISSAMEEVNKSNRKDYMLMRLIDTDNKYYKWEVLPYGSFSGYKYGMKIFKNKIIMFSFLALSIYGGYKLLKNGI
jgi:hypothetical protein